MLSAVRNSQLGIRLPTDSSPWLPIRQSTEPHLHPVLLHQRRVGAEPRQCQVGQSCFETSSRLGFPGIELLNTGRLELPIGGEPAEWLKGVRCGGVAFGEWWERVLALDAALGAMESDESLPERSDSSKIEAGPCRSISTFGVANLHDAEQYSRGLPDGWEDDGSASIFVEDRSARWR
jgi:hypothetical protein